MATNAEPLQSMAAFNINQTPTNPSSQVIPHFQTTEQPLLLTPPASTRINNNKQFLSKLSTCINNNKQLITRPSAALKTDSNEHLYFQDNLHLCFQPTLMKYNEFNGHSLQDHTHSVSIH